MMTLHIQFLFKHTYMSYLNMLIDSFYTHSLKLFVYYLSSVEDGIKKLNYSIIQDKTLVCV